jgi:hypothetical protein
MKLNPLSTNHRTVAVLLGATLSMSTIAGAQDKKPAPDPSKRQVLFGEQHLHTSSSFDAFTVGVTASWEDAYRYGRGEEIPLSTTGEKMKRRTPYDFVGITDHSEYYGVLKDLVDPKNPLSKSELGQSLMKMKTDPKAASAAVVSLIVSINNSDPIPEFVTAALRKSYWQKFIETADKFNDPGKFTALYAFEWTCIPAGANMHRNVFFKDKPAAMPFSSFDSQQTEDLWTYLEINRREGIECFAIPHNGNVSDGWMFSRNKFQGADKFSGGLIDGEYARRQMENEPLFEMHQTKGNSEAHPWLSPNDEFASFEPFDSLIALNSPSAIKGGFYRQGLIQGMKIESEVGFNPYKMGAVAGADVHSGYSGNEEFNWKGAHGQLDDTAKKRLDPTPNATGESGYTVSSAGATAVWADENTRSGIFDAMKRKETYGTTGTLIRLRLFAGWGLADDLAEDKEFAKKGYSTGVPMGSDLPANPKGVKAPSIAIQVMKDPESGNLDRVQVIKGWTDPSNSMPRDKVYDVAWSDKRVPDPTTGKLPHVGNTCDVKTGKYTNDIGDSQLSVVWTDPDFDPTLKAVYYVRVLEIPTPRWSTYDAIKLGVALPEGVPATIQERAYSSPVWYTPASKATAKK